MLFAAIFLLLSTTTHTDDNKNNYLDLMKKCLINSIYEDAGSSMLHHGYEYHKQERENGLDWPNVAHTMIGLHRLNNLQFCIEDVLAMNVEGDFIETGVWRGGATIFMRAMLKAYNITDRIVFAADSFAGLPPPNAKLYPADKNYDLSSFKILAVSLEQVQSNFACYGLLDNQVVFLKGLFKDSLPNAPIQKLAILRLDGDLYESTMDALTNLYPKLSIGGYVIIDDYQIPCCAQAVHDFRKQFHITDPMYKTGDDVAVYWKRTK
jgi:hypothetical protein